jgi:hypothetical protein
MLACPAKGKLAKACFPPAVSRTAAVACAGDRRDLQDERTGRRAGHRSGQGGGLYSVAFVVVNAEQAEDWNGASGREFIEQRERHEQMLGRLRSRLLAAARLEPEDWAGSGPSS